MTEPARPSRRDLLSRACACAGGLGAVAAAGAWGASLVPRVLYEPPAARRLGPPDRYPEGLTFLADERVFVVREGTSLRALSAVCTHLGCTVQKAEAGFRCPCHGSSFSDGGANTGGPAPRPLPWRPLTQGGDGSLWVDLGREVGPDVAFVLPEGPR